MSKITLINSYKKHIRRFRQIIDHKMRKSKKLSFIRFLIFVIGFVFTSLAFSENLFLGVCLLLVTTTMFSMVVYHHLKLKDSIHKHQLWIHLKQELIARIDLDWDRIPEPPPYTRDPSHPFDFDLNITGPFSLQHLLDQTISTEGHQKLKKQLLHPSLKLEDITHVQNIVQRLKPFERFHQKFVLFSRLSSEEKLKGDDVEKVLKQHIPLKPFWFSLQLALLILTFISLALQLSYGVGNYWLVPFLAYIAGYIKHAKLFFPIFDEIIFLDNELKKYERLFRFLESEKQAMNAIQEFGKPFLTQKKPSSFLNKLQKITMALSLRTHPLLFILLNGCFPWDFFFILKLNHLKQSLAVRFREWTDDLSTIEMLNSLASFAHLNPEYQFPQVSKHGSHYFNATNLGHPLIHSSQKITNNFTIQNINDIGLITGSNMSGKSTFLRTIGINLVLAYSGTVINANQLDTSIFRVFTCIQIDDSLKEGISYFYAEVRRLKSLLDALNENDDPPVFYLIDEIFTGTNNRERLIGSQAYIKKLVTYPAVGLVSTHDLELTQLQNDIPSLHNYHFREDFKKNEMVFHYKINSGASPTTNALKVMEICGLPVN